MFLLLDHIFCYKNRNLPKRIILAHTSSLGTFPFCVARQRLQNFLSKCPISMVQVVLCFPPLTLRPAELHTCCSLFQEERAQLSFVLFLTLHHSQHLPRKWASSSPTEIGYKFGNNWTWSKESTDTKKINCLSCTVWPICFLRKNKGHVVFTVAT